MNPAPVYRGLTWDHPRGYAALEEAASQARSRGEIDITWERQPLEGFESSAIDELAERYDLIVLDHPHVGDAVAAQCLLPLDQCFDADQLGAWCAASVGHSFDSYHLAGHQWALPLDAATQVAALRADRIEGPVPDTWLDVLALARRQPVGLSLAGPHAVLSLFSIAAAHGARPASDDPDTLFSGDGAGAAWALLRELHAVADARHAALNPIGLLGAMARPDGVVYCPLVYGYVNYTVAHNGGAALRFAEAPAGPTGQRGSTLGGTGVAVSSRAAWTPALRDHLTWLMSPTVQAGLIPQHQGQPSARAAWEDETVNASRGGFFQRTRQTTEQALVRPRHAGYIAFQTAASAAVRQALADRASATNVLATLQALHERHHQAGAPA